MRHITRHGIFALLGLAALAMILTAGTQPALARATIYVDANVVGGNDDGTTWANAYDDLQEALLGSLSSGDVIKVAGGTYYPHASDQTVTFLLIDGVKLQGGYHGTCPGGECDADARDETSILSGDIDDDGLDADNSQHVLRASDTTDLTVLDGFTVTMGYADGGFPHWAGGGALIENCEEFTINNCVFDENYAKNNGGAVAVWIKANGPASSETTIQDCNFTSNEAGDIGGALRFGILRTVTDHNISILDTDFSNNKTPLGGVNTAETGGAVAIVSETSRARPVAGSGSAIRRNSRPRRSIFARANSSRTRRTASNPATVSVKAGRFTITKGR